LNSIDAMRRYRGEIARNLDAAERLCEKIHVEHGHCFLGTDCAFHAAFKKCRPFGCEMKGIREVMGEHCPPGLCPYGIEQGKEIRCNGEPFTCPFQTIPTGWSWKGEMPVILYCGREAAALQELKALGEEEQQDPRLALKKKIKGEWIEPVEQPEERGRLK
jgi:hypothetical protein